MKPEPWARVGDDELVHEGWLSVIRRRYRQPDGREDDWEMLARFVSVSVLALTPEGRVVAVRQFRPGPDAVVLNLPGGLVDEGEAPEAAAARELTEETGYVAAHVEIVASCHPMAWGDWTRYVAVARDCLPTGQQHLDDGEDCVPVELSVPELRAELRSGRLVGTDGAYLALDHAGLL